MDNKQVFNRHSTGVQLVLVYTLIKRKSQVVHKGVQLVEIDTP